MWDRVDDRLGALELLATGALCRRARQEAAFAWLAELPWTRAASRRDEITLVARHRPALVALLDRVWSDWREVQVALLEAGLDPTPAGHDRLQDLLRRRGAPDLPFRLNRRTAAAVVGPGSKSSLTTTRQLVLEDHEVVDDGLVRIRPPPGLVALRGGRRLPLDEVTDVLNEVAVTDRALRDGLVLEGGVDAVLLVENLGAWRDLPRPGRWLFAHVPGWNTGMVRGLLALVGDVPVVHFGDLDPNGVRIVRHVRGIAPRVRWLLPEFWGEYLPMHGMRRAWPEELDVSGLPAWARDVVEQGLWLEQELLVLDPRMQQALEALLG